MPVSWEFRHETYVIIVLFMNILNYFVYTYVCMGIITCNYVYVRKFSYSSWELLKYETEPFLRQPFVKALRWMKGRVDGVKRYTTSSTPVRSVWPRVGDPFSQHTHLFRSKFQNVFVVFFAFNVNSYIFFVFVSRNASSQVICVTNWFGRLARCLIVLNGSSSHEIFQG